MDKHTSKKTSEQLKEWGCDLPRNYEYIVGFNPNLGFEGEIIEGSVLVEADDGYCIQNGIFYDGDMRPVEKNIEVYPAYDLLWDVCIKYPDKFFGVDEIIFNRQSVREYYDNRGRGIREGRINHIPDYQFHSEQILQLLQQNKKEEAEEYLLSHTIFNPKNK